MTSKTNTEIGKRAIMVLAAMVLALVVSAGAALAITKTCQANVECFGTNNPDTLTGTAGDDRIHGLGAADTLKGLGLNDRLHGEGGADKLFGGPGIDFMAGGPGPDALSGGADRDIYFFGPGWGKDTVAAGPEPREAVFFRKSAFEDVPVTDGLTIRLAAGKGPEVKTEGAANTVNWDDGAVIEVSGGAGSDEITGSFRDEGIGGGPGGSDTIAAGAGDDVIGVLDGAADDVVSCGDPFIGSDFDRVSYDEGDQIADDCEVKNGSS